MYSEKESYVLEVFRHHNDQVAQLMGGEFSSGTLERYKTSLDHTRSFLKWKYNVPDLDIRKADYAFISGYASGSNLFGNAATTQPTPIIISEG